MCIDIIKKFLKPREEEKENTFGHIYIAVLIIPVSRFLHIASDHEMSRYTALSSPCRHHDSAAEEGIKKVLYIFEILTFLWKNN